MTAALDFATLPPEINSARMYSGAGSAPMLAQRQPGTACPQNCAPAHCHTARCFRR
ncbi:PPE family protein [Mycobacterium tuberculosis]|nr:PPE family protein [Mycobacterium tuberculosis]